MVSGEWAGTMNLTEPHAGSDLGALTTRAQAAGRHLSHLRHQDLHHLRRPRADRQHHPSRAGPAADAPPGTRGISLFLVPKWLVNTDGSLGARNDVVCASLEHKLGIHASPTAVMKYGEKDGAIGYLVG